MLQSMVEITIVAVSIVPGIYRTNFYGTYATRCWFAFESERVHELLTCVKIAPLTSK